MAESTTQSPPPKPEKTHVIVRSYPKFVYLYLTWIAAIVCGLLMPTIEQISEEKMAELGWVRKQAEEVSDGE